MQLDTSRNILLPRQAWVVHVRDGAAHASVGAGVHLSERGFYEGGLALTPGPEALRSAGIHVGSGGVVGRDGLCLVSPSHTSESIYVARSGEHVWAANSLPLLVGACRPDGLTIWSLRRAIKSITSGLVKYQRMIYSEPQLSIYRFANAFVRIERDGGLSEIEQRQTTSFPSYEAYERFLVTVITEALHSYGSTRLAVYLSRGYDSTATAALASRIGPTNAITMDRGHDGDADDGSAIAATLGLPVSVLRRKERHFRVAHDRGQEIRWPVVSPEEYGDIFEFFSGVDLRDESLKAPEIAVHDRAVLTGHYGDHMWGFAEMSTDDLRTRGMSCSGLGEYRLRTVFMHIPVPVLAFNRIEEIHAIARSEAMRPWSLGGDYDRPIPRRIAEERGVPREGFGMKKQFASAVIANVHVAAATLFEMQKARYRPALRDWAFSRERVTRASVFAAPRAPSLASNDLAGVPVG